MIWQTLINKFSKDPKQLLLADGFGALLSAFLLGFVLVQLQPLVGMPRTTLYFLAALPCFFAVYDFYCYFKINKNIGPYLRAIAYANIGYCVLSFALLFFHANVLTPLGWFYFIVEILIVLAVAKMELSIEVA